MTRFGFARNDLARNLGTLAFAAVALAACGGGSDDEHQATHIETAGRLALLEDGAKEVRIYDLDSRSVAQAFTMVNAPSAIYASPGNRYALAMQRSQDLVQVIDGGIWQEDHLDHKDDFKMAPKQSDFALTGIRPTHYAAHDEVAAFFMDGLTETGQAASVHVISDASLGKAALEAKLDLPVNMHGTAEPRDNYLLTTYRSPDNTDTLPVQVGLYQRNGSGYDFVRRFDETCPSLHGSFSNEDHTVFGCSDGILVVSQSGEDFSAKKIANPADIGTDVRIGTIAGHHEQARMVGIASPGHLFDIDPVAGTITRIAWTEGRTRRAHAFDAEGVNFLVLDDLGVVHVLDASDNWAVRAALPTIATMPTVRPFPSIAASGAADKAFVTDPAGRSIAVIDLEKGQLGERIALDFSPTGIAWLGIAQHAH